MPFPHLHTSTGFSWGYGASHVADLVARAAERGIPTLALTDRDTTIGTTRFLQACDQHGIRPILGVDLAVAARRPSGPHPRTRTPARGGAHVSEPALRTTVLAQDRAGWTRLCRLLSSAHAGPDAPTATWHDLHTHATDHLTVLLGPNAEPLRALTIGRTDLAEQLLAPWQDLAGQNLRLEIVCYGLPGTGPGSVRLAAHTLQLADRLGVTAVLTNAVRYANPDQHRLADVLDSARLLRPIDRRRLDCGERWLKDPAAMAELAGRVALAAGCDPRRAARLLDDTRTTAEQCVLDPVTDLRLGTAHFPEPQAVGADATPGAGARLLRERCEAGMVRRGLDRDREALQRLDAELEVIARLGFESYFLAVGQVVQDVRDMGIRVAARGSGAGSMVNHALYIAAANPLSHRLLFERFVNEKRASLPDIDLDVESAKRLAVYDRIIERFGPERIAVTGMPETYRARQALRDCSLALGIAPPEADRIAKAFPHIRASDIRAALAELPELRDLAAVAERYGPLWELAEGLDKLVTQYSMHPCGVILSDATLLDRLPVQPTAAGYPMVQADKDDVDLAGGFGWALLKLDVLGVRMQSAMAHAAAEIRRTTGQDVDLDDAEQVDPADFFAFKLIQEARTLGCFQLESPGQQDLLSRLQPRDVQDVIADISLFRPGPVAGGMPERYIAARHGTAPAYAHPDLEPVLGDTYGVTIWHEQIIDTFAQLTGCSREMGEVARRALGDERRLPALETWFRQQASARGYSQQVLDEVWETVREFGAYGFCRAHAVAFAVPALQSAWLKAHHPAALLAGLLEHDPGMWPRRVLVADARRHGVAVLPVNVNRSRPQHSVEPTEPGHWGVRLALTAVKGIRDDEVQRLAEGQPYASLSDLWQRARPTRPTAERLAQIGALADLATGLTRRDLLLQITEMHRQSRTRTADGQLLLDDSPLSAEPSGLPEMTSREALGAELTVLQIDVTTHLIEHHHRLLREIGATDAAHLADLDAGRTVLVAGVRASVQTPPIASGKRVIFLTLEDGSGMVDVALFQDSHPRCAHTVFHSGLLLIRGTVSRRGNRRTVVGTMAWDLDRLAAARRDHGPQAALALLGTDAPAPPSTPAAPGAGRTLTDGTTGARLHAWADLQPAGTRSADLTALGHASPGSAG
ncbi:error-prone DNA polymerase [Streptacidiphilus sp. EB103A]